MQQIQPLMIKSSSSNDLLVLAKIQQKAFPKSFSSKLGLSFLMKMFSWHVVSERGSLFHLEECGKIIGYCGAIKTKTRGLPGSASSITQFTMAALIKSFLFRPWLFFHPEFLKKRNFIIRNIQAKIFGKKSPNSGKNRKDEYDSFKPYWGLTVIAVDPICQGKGYGSKLLLEFEKQAKSDGVARVSLSVLKNNSRAIKSYTSNGWRIANPRTEDSAYQMYKDI